MEKHIWRKRWLDSINELTSLELQKKTWSDNENPHWTFVEFMECYFDDLLLGDNYFDALKSGFVSGEEFEILQNWHIKLETYSPPNNDDYDHKAILADQNWIEIVNLGNEIKLKLSKVLNAREKDILINKKNAA